MSGVFRLNFGKETFLAFALFLVFGKNLFFGTGFLIFRFFLCRTVFCFCIAIIRFLFFTLVTGHIEIGQRSEPCADFGFSRAYNAENTHFRVFDNLDFKLFPLRTEKGACILYRLIYVF